MSGLRELLLAVREDAGELTPPAVVDAARPLEHPLHERFEWDDSLAGEAYRRVQARELIQSVRIEYVRANGTTGHVRAFHSIAGEDPARPHYEPVEEIVEDPVARAVLVAQMRREWTIFRARYEHLCEFAELVAGEVTS